MRVAFLAAPPDSAIPDELASLPGVEVERLYQGAASPGLLSDPPQLILLESPGPECGALVREAATTAIPLLLLDPLQPLLDTLSGGELYSILRSPWTARELEAAIILLRRGGSYRDSGLPEEAGRSLSARELDVLTRLAEGWTNRGIAGVLGISENTVKYHLASIYRKLGAESRTEALMLAARRGILSL